MVRNILLRTLIGALLCAGVTSSGLLGASDSQEPVAAGNVIVESKRSYRQLLSKIKTEPLAALLIKDVKQLSTGIFRTSIGQLWLDKRYSESRRAVLKECSEMMGFDARTFWGRLEGNLVGPLLIVIEKTDPLNGDRLHFGATVMLTAIDADSAKAIWVEVKKHTKWLDWVQLHIVAPSQHPEKEPDVTLLPWAQDFVEKGGLLRFRVQASSLIQMQKYKNEDAFEKFPFLQKAMAAVGALMDRSVKHFTWSMDLDGKDFVDHLDMELVEDAKGTFPLLLSVFGEGRSLGQGLGGVLPGRQDGAVFLNVNVSEVSEELLNALQLLERVLRGKKWTRRFGSSKEAVATDRFDFISTSLSGLIGFSARLALSGQVDLVLAGATKTQKPADIRKHLIVGLKELGAPFKELEKATRIGSEMPWAANFKGRSFLPAPVIGLSKGWVWLCSTPAAYQSLTRSLAKGQMLADDPYLKTRETKASPNGVEPLVASSFSLRLNLLRVFPLVYTAWLLSEDGPKLGSHSIPLRFLPQPNVFAKRFATFRTDLLRDGFHIRAYGRGPIPGGAILPVGMMVRVAQLLDRLKQKREEHLQRVLEKLNQPDPTKINSAKGNREKAK